MFYFTTCNHGLILVVFPVTVLLFHTRFFRTCIFQYLQFQRPRTENVINTLTVGWNVLSIRLNTGQFFNEQTSYDNCLQQLSYNGRRCNIVTLYFSALSYV